MRDFSFDVLEACEARPLVRRWGRTFQNGTTKDGLIIIIAINAGRVYFASLTDTLDQTSLVITKR